MAKILVIESEVGMRNALYNMLKPVGAKVFTAGDGRSALALSGELLPEIALLDTKIADMPWQDILSKLRSICPSIKIILLPGMGELDVAVEAQQAGAYECLGRPFKIEAVIECVKKALSGLPGMENRQVGFEEVKAEPAYVPVMPGRKRSYLITFMAGALFLAVLGGTALFFSGKIRNNAAKFYEIRLVGASSMCWSGGQLSVLFQKQGKVSYFVPGTTLEPVQELKISTASYSGIAYDGENTWLSDPAEHRIMKFSQGNLIEYSGVFDTKSRSLSYICSDGAYIWGLDTLTGSIVKFKMDESFTELESFDCPARQPCGLYADGEHVYICDSSNTSIYIVSSSDFATNQVYQIAKDINFSGKITQTAWDRDKIWVYVQSAGKIYTVPNRNKN